MSLEADYIIVGGGLTGCALASRLAHSEQSPSVLILEAGQNPTDKHDIVTPFGGFALAGTELDWQYKTAPAASLDGRTFTLQAGKTLGGGSVLNYGGWSRGVSDDYDAWARGLNDDRWSYKGLLPYMKRAEKFISKTDNSQHGFDGPMKITGILDSNPKRRFPLREPLAAGWSEIGVEEVQNPCSGKLDGMSEFLENWNHGKRQPAHLAYNMEKVKVVSNCRVDKIIMSNLVATGVVLQDGRTATAKKEVIVSAGTFQTPTILLRSGINLPSIGTNYSDHFAVYQLYKLKKTDHGLSLGHPDLSDPAFFSGLPMDWVTNEAPPRSEMEKALDEDGVTGPERDALLQPNRTYIETMILYTAMAPGVPMDGTYITTSLLLTVPTSRGRVSLSPSDTTDGRPTIETNYFSTAFDRLCLTHGVKRLARLLLDTKAMAPYVECEAPPPGMEAITTKSTDAEIVDRIVKTGMPHFHPVGTCAMGKVVDSDLRVKGVKGLRVCDASVCPTSVGGHPMATMYGIAEMAADIILGKV